MPRRDRRERYMRDRASRKNYRSGRDYGYQMDYAYDDSERRYRYDAARSRDRYQHEDYDMDYEQPRKSRGVYDSNMRGDYAKNGIGRPREYRRDYASDDYDKEYHEDLQKWADNLKKYDRFNMPKEQLLSSAKQMGVNFNDYDEEEFYTIYLMHVSDYPTLSNEPHVYLGMAKSWLEDKDLDIEPSEKVCKYLYEIVMADED